MLLVELQRLLDNALHQVFGLGGLSQVGGRELPVLGRVVEPFDGGYAAYILMPASGKLADFVRTLDAAHFAAAANSLTSQRLHVEVPRFTARYKTSLNQPLAAAGMGVAFSGGADFSNIRTTSPRVAISDVEHATYLSVDEAGTTAAAATSIGFRALAMPAAPKQFIVDKPFIFAIRDEKIGALLFIGAIGTIPPSSS